MNDIDDKLKGIIERIYDEGARNEYVYPDSLIMEIKALFPSHGVCADCKLMEKYDFCVFLRREIKLPTKQSCSEFEPKVKP